MKHWQSQRRTATAPSNVASVSTHLARPYHADCQNHYPGSNRAVFNFCDAITFKVFPIRSKVEADTCDAAFVKNPFHSFNHKLPPPDDNPVRRFEFYSLIPARSRESFKFFHRHPTCAVFVSRIAINK